MDNGGGATLISYGQNYGDIVNVKVVPEQHLRWIEALPLMHVDRHRIYKGPDQRGHGTRHVVHGHHQFRDGPVTIAGRTNLDTQAWYTGRLVIGVFDDEVAGGPVSLLEVHGEPVEIESKKK